ncbi:ABC-F family ATP-binding cassette domain-containing protein [Serinibacter salmoneus]|nr:ATP-binding cassette domain-containing protein [Serinibacter salmoneus]
MGHLDLSDIALALPDGRPLLGGVSLRVGEGHRMALVGPNGTGKTTLLRIAAGDLAPDEGAVVRSGGLGVMRQFIGSVRDETTVRDLLLGVAPERIRVTGRAVDAAEEAMLTRDDEPAQLAYAQALADWGEAGGYEQETVWDMCTTASLALSFERAAYRRVATLSGGEQKRLVLEALLRGSDEVLLLDEPDNYLDVPGKRWLEEALVASGKTVLLVSHDRELLERVATRVATLEPGAAGARLWVHPGGFGTYAQARVERNAKLEERRRRWDEEHAKLVALVQMYKVKAAYNDGLAARYHAAQTRLAKFEQAGPPEEVSVEQQVTMRLRGGRTARRAVIVEDLGLTGLAQPFSEEIWFGERIGVLGANGTGKSHFLRLLAAGGTDPDIEHQPVGEVIPEPVRATGVARLGSRVRPGWFAQTHDHPTLHGRTLLEILHRGDAHRPGMPREQASRALDRYGLARSAEQTFQTLSGGQQARMQILLLELSGATLLLLDEPTDNLDLASVESLEQALEAFEGTVVAVTHDRYFARGLDRFLVFDGEGRVSASDEPVWEVARAGRH